jgi:hypothetical protein
VNRCHLLGLLLGLLALGACQRREAMPAVANDDLQKRMGAIQEELRELQKNLGEGVKQQGVGRGAYSDGPFSITSAETVLERLHRTEQTLAEAQQALADKNRTIIALQQENNDHRLQIADLGAKAERLAHAEASRMTAIQERNATLADFEELRQRLVTVDLSRLERERDYYNLVTEIIRLEPGHTQDFFALQQRMKEQARNLPQPSDRLTELPDQGAR